MHVFVSFEFQFTFNIKIKKKYKNDRSRRRKIHKPFFYSAVAFFLVAVRFAISIAIAIAAVLWFAGCLRFQEGIDLFANKGLPVRQIDAEELLELTADPAGRGLVEVGVPKDVREASNKLRVRHHG